MNLDRVWALDLETTGTDTEKDRIVQIAIKNIGTGESLVFTVNPGVPIPPEATEVHGISNADVANALPFGTIASKIREKLHNSVIVGYNVKKFDWPLLRNQYIVIRRDPPKPIAIIDSYLWLKKNERMSLEWAYHFYTGDELEGAHDALVDVEATIEVFKRQVELYVREDIEIGAIKSYGQLEQHIREPYLDDGNKFLERDDGTVVVTFGKYAGTPIVDLDPGYVAWMIREFSDEERKIIEKATR